MASRVAAGRRNSHRNKDSRVVVSNQNNSEKQLQQ